MQYCTHQSWRARMYSRGLTTLHFRTKYGKISYFSGVFGPPGLLTETLRADSGHRPARSGAQQTCLTSFPRDPKTRPSVKVRGCRWIRPFQCPEPYIARHHRRFVLNVHPPGFFVFPLPCNPHLKLLENIVVRNLTEPDFAFLTLTICQVGFPSQPCVCPRGRR